MMMQCGEEGRGGEEGRRAGRKMAGGGGGRKTCVAAAAAAGSSPMRPPHPLLGVGSTLSPPPSKSSTCTQHRLPLFLAFFSAIFEEDLGGLMGPWHVRLSCMLAWAAGWGETLTWRSLFENLFSKCSKPTLFLLKNQKS